MTKPGQKVRPIQPYVKTDTINYREEEYLQHGISHFYAFECLEHQELRIVPDGCMDLIFVYTKDGMTGYVRGTTTEFRRQRLSGIKWVFGVKFLPGVQPALIKVHMGEMPDRYIEMKDVLIGNRYWLSDMEDQVDFEQCIKFFLQAYHKVEKTTEPLYENRAIGLVYSNIGKTVQLINDEGAEITEYVVPEEVTSIGSSAFRNCTGLTTVTIPSNLTNIGSNAFSGCNGIKLVKVPVADCSAFCENKAVGLICSNIGKPIQLIDNDGAEITEYVVPNGVTSIGSSAFRNCTGLTSITIPYGLTSIGSYAFSGCNNFNSVKVPVTDYAYFCQNKAVGLIYSNIGRPIQLINKDGAEITEYVVPEGVTSIGSSVFRNCTGLTSVTIPNGVRSIGDAAFSGCSGLSSFDVPNSVSTIGGSAFQSCTGLTSITIPGGITSIGSNAFSGCYGITLVKVTVTDYASFCENKAVGLVYSNIGKPVQLIDNEGAEITEYVVPNGVTAIGSSTFRNCTGLTSIKIGSGVTNIGEYAFSGCGSLATVIAMSNVPPHVEENTFSDVKNISLFVPQGRIAVYEAADGWRFFKEINEWEGIIFKANGHVDMQRHLWEPEMEL